MTRIEQIARKKERFIVGLMSGTSIDSIDAVVAKVRGSGISTSFKQIAFHSHRYPKGYKEYVLQNSHPGGGNVDAISSLNILISHFSADAVFAVIKKAGLSPAQIDLIGSHGQTIHHLPKSQNIFGKKIHSTLQIGDPSTIAKLTGIITVGNFRTGDMAVGGQGAPLVPFFDFVAFRSSKYNRALLNIGGIANITLIKKNCAIHDIIALDTGPGNMIIDVLMYHFFGRQFDRNGLVASRGNILPSLLKQLIQHPYFDLPLPKSTGREDFGDTFVKKILHISRGETKENIIATVTEFTALTIFDQYNRFLRKRLKRDTLHELIISGGGSHNSMIVESLKKLFFPATIVTSNDCGVDSESKEALCFALLANETVCGNAANIPSVTGASKRTILGTISL
ncbi:MAG: anhydro-N-acetylmuramic acid kinase [Bacteroidota bacterium]